jgi:AbrB family looped-hinge helix DNA binding protein
MSTTTLTSKGQVTLPKAVRDRLALKRGDRLRVTVASDGRVTLERERQPPVDQVCGLLRRLAPRRPASIAAMRAAIRRRARRKHQDTRRA